MAPRLLSAFARRAQSRQPGWSETHRAQYAQVASGSIGHVLLLSVDGMHVVNFYKWANRRVGVNGGNTYCPESGSPQPDRDQLCGRRIVDALRFLSRIVGSDFWRIAEDDRSLLRCCI
jgi:hypothetical protein